MHQTQPQATELCPKCGVAMELIEAGVDGPPVEQLQLCPSCYLVMWDDANGMHVRQGVPMKKGSDPNDQTGWSAGEPKEC